MAQLGTNIEREGISSPEFVNQFGAERVRIPLTPDTVVLRRLRKQYDGFKRLGIEVLWIIDSTSVSGFESFEAAAIFYREHLDTRRDKMPRIQTLQLGNEPDIDSPSSWTQTVDEVNGLLNSFRTVFPDRYLVGPGLASGDPNKMQGVNWDLVNAIAIHPYGQAVPDYLPSGEPNPTGGYNPYGFGGNVDELLLNYVRIFGKPIWITEWGANDQELGIDDAATYGLRMLSYLRNYSRTLSELGFEDPNYILQVALQFCLYDHMVLGFGMINEAGNLKPIGQKFMEITGVGYEERESGLLMPRKKQLARISRMPNRIALAA